jgi:hypothetical protein
LALGICREALGLGMFVVWTGYVFLVVVEYFARFTAPMFSMEEDSFQFWSSVVLCGSLGTIVDLVSKKCYKSI